MLGVGEREFSSWSGKAISRAYSHAEGRQIYTADALVQNLKSHLHSEIGPTRFFSKTVGCLLGANLKERSVPDGGVTLPPITSHQKSGQNTKRSQDKPEHESDSADSLCAANHCASNGAEQPE